MTSPTSPKNVFLVMGLKEDKVLFAVVVAGDPAKAATLFTSKHPDHELMTISSLYEMEQAVQLLSYVKEGKDLQDQSFPMVVYREHIEVDAGQFGL